MEYFQIEKFYKGFKWITNKLAIIGHKDLIINLHDNLSIQGIIHKFIEYNSKGKSTNISIISALYDYGFLSNKEIQLIRDVSNYRINQYCKYGREHSYDEDDGKCEICGIIGCAAGIREHFFESSGKCEYCGIIGCAVGLTDHYFGYFKPGKCKYCGIIGCTVGLLEHNFSDNNIKCQYCRIIGCKIGLKSHTFNSYNKCIYCGNIGCKIGLKSHTFNSNNKCIYCGIIGCKRGFKPHIFNSNNKCIYCRISKISK